ncbi:JmjC domain-containing protein [Micromonospora sp. CPCC 205561]|uniref:JmjC domain-containing protein n=1 Tax=Micromonospora sp. CPCC 205561 TaxID=3122407 RepID=UPI002FF2210D
MPTPHPLTRLVREADVFGERNWNSRHVLLKQALPLSAFIDEDELQRIIDMPLFRRPYFSVLKEGVWANPERVTRTETRDGVEIEGLANPTGIRQALKQGATLKLNQLEDWHRPTRDLVREIETLVPAEVKSYMFYTPQDNTGMLPHRDGSHVLAVQLTGRKEWRLYASQIDGRPGLDVDPDAQTHEFVMDPGDVLYLPHGYPHAATARGGSSLHLTLTITEPGPLELIEALLATFTEENDYLMRHHPRMRVDDKAAAVSRALLAHLDEVESGRLVEQALGQMRRRIV